MELKVESDAKPSEIFTEIQNWINIRKDTRNEFGNFNYRKMDVIIAKIKPVFRRFGFYVRYADSIESHGEWNYIRSEIFVLAATTDQIISSGIGYAREIPDKAKMDMSQLTGVATTYARKSAWSALLNLADAESDEIEPGYIDDESIANLEKIIDRIKKAGGEFDLSRFLVLFRAKSLKDIAEQDYNKAVVMLKQKERECESN